MPRRFRFSYSHLIAHAWECVYLVVKSEHQESAQAFYEASQHASLPVVIVAIPRTSAAIEFFPIPGQKLSCPAQKRIRESAGDVMRGSVAKKRTVNVRADGGVIRGVHRDRAPAFAAQLAEMLRDDASYRAGKVLDFPGRSRTGEIA